MDKYDLTFSIFHELKARIDNDKNSDVIEHYDFGGALMAPGIPLHASDGRLFYRLDSPAWNFLKELLILKIKDGNGSSQNNNDLL